MKKDLGAKPYLFPMPVLIIGTYNEDGTPDAMSAAWGCISDYKKVALYLSCEHKTYENILKRKAFTVAVADEKNLASCDYVGLVSAKSDSRKMEKSRLTVAKSSRVDAPIINELPITLECKLDYIDEKAECVYGEIVNVLADEEVLTDGEIDLNKFTPISFDPSGRKFFALGRQVGVAFHDGASLK